MERIPDVSPEIPTRTWRLLLRLLGTLPERAMSRSFGRLADLRLPLRVRGRVHTSFARAVGVDLSEVERPLGDYPSLNAFFVRRLRPGARTWPADPGILASPVDGLTGRSGRIDRERLVQAKGHDYTVADLLGEADDARRFQGGRFLTIYLSPRHYHRIHTPLAGVIPAARYLPGALFPVNAPAVMHIPHLFVRNERLICYVDGALGRIAVVAVGAYNVGRISASFDPQWGGGGEARPWVTNRRPPASLLRVYDPPLPVATGEELMVFHLGSTVILLLEPGVELAEGLEPGRELRVGEPIALP